jgi:putative ABC transport system ATP-binding protein
MEPLALNSLPLLAVQDLGRQLGDRWLWRGVSFDLHGGDCLGLVAPSGVGKTLLIRNLALLDPIQRGTVALAGKSPAAWGLPVYRSRVMVVPQRAFAWEGTVRANLERGFSLRSQAHHHFDLAKILGWLDQLGRGPDFLNLEGDRLSGGEAQILALLRALQFAPQVLLLDEPTASLDTATALQAEALLHQWLQEPDRACIVTSHDHQQIDRVTTHRLALEDFAE